MRKVVTASLTRNEKARKAKGIKKLSFVLDQRCVRADNHNF